jgi:ATP-dependent RNA helicase DDX19/DBP5
MSSLLKNLEQVVLFSATFPPAVIEYAQRFAPNANVLTLAHDELTIEGIKQLFIDINGQQDKFATLLKFYGLMTQASSIIFVRVSGMHPMFASLLTSTDSKNCRGARESHGPRRPHSRPTQRRPSWSRP